MKVLDLLCGAGHGFEGWFGSEADYLDQHGRGLIACPVCGAADVQRMPSAPRLNLSGARAPAETPAKPSPDRAAPAAVSPADRSQRPGPDGAAEIAYLQAVRHVLANSEDVGNRFADEARRIHHGEVENRHIRGQTSPEEARALHDEGIEVFSLPIPAGLDKPLQ